MWVAIVKFATGPWGAILGKVLLAVLAAGAIFFAVHSYNDSIRDAERQRNQIAQYEQVIKDNQELGRKLDVLQDKSDKILEDTQNKNNIVTEKHTEVTRYIQSPEAQKSNRETSTVIKETIRMLNDEE